MQAGLQQWAYAMRFEHGCAAGVDVGADMLLRAAGGERLMEREAPADGEVLGGGMNWMRPLRSRFS